MKLPLVFQYAGDLVVYQMEPAGPTARILGRKETLAITPELQAAIDAAAAHELEKAS